MMKTLEETKKVLRECDEGYACRRIHCPYDDGLNLGNGSRCMLDTRKDALAHIQQLEAQNAELVRNADELAAKVPKWISVEERLPDGPGEVLVVLYGCVVNAWYCGDGEFETGSGLVLRNDGVTHWMPLPEPPEEG